VKVRSVERWTWDGRLDLRFERGRVTSFTILDAAMRSTPDRAGVGASLTAARRALGRLVRDASGGRRGLVALSRTKIAEVRLRVGRNGKVARVSVTTRSRNGLDRAARALLERAR
jgi:hypothetical protein